MHTDVALEDLRLLARIGQAGSIGRAAAELDLSQPHASRRIKALERSTGLLLLERSKRGASLTACGHLVTEWAADLMSASEEFSRRVQTLRHRSPMSLTLAASMTVAEYYTPEWLLMLRRVEPRAVVSVSVHNSGEVCELVTRGEADLGLVESPHIGTELRSSLIGSDDLAVAVPAGDEWSGTEGAPLDVGDLAARPLLVRERGSGTRETLEESLQGRGFALSVGIEMASNTALKQAAIAGLGPVVVSRRCIESDVESGRLVEVDFQGLSLRRPLSAVWRKGEELHPWASALLALASGQAKVG